MISYGPENITVKKWSIFMKLNIEMCKNRVIKRRLVIFFKQHVVMSTFVIM